MSAKLPTFFKLPAHNRFNYIPRFYDEESEKKEANRRKLRYHAMIKANNENISDRIFRAKSSESDKSRRLSLIIRLALIILFSLVVYMIARYLGWWTQYIYNTTR